MYPGGREPQSRPRLSGKEWKVVGEVTGVGGGVDGVSAAGIGVSLIGV